MLFFFLIQKRSVKLNYTSDQWLKHYICFLWGDKPSISPALRSLSLTPALPPQQEGGEVN